MIRVAFLSISVSLCFISASAGQNRRAAVPPIPDTISEGSQEFLRNAPPIPAAAQTLEEWEALQKSTEQKEGPRSKEAFDKFAEKREIRKMGGVDVHVITPKSFNPANADKALIHIHGGGFCTYTSESSYFVCTPIADLTGLVVYCVDYRLAPQHPFPAGLNDCVAAYREIIKEVAPEHLGVFGVSAGGSLILAMTLKARDEGLPMPGALASITPATDMTGRGDAYGTNDGLDPILATVNVPYVAKAYAGDADLTNPLISVVYAKYSEEFPSTFIQTGTRDLLLSDCVRLHRTMKDSGVDVELSVWEGMWHAFQVVPDISRPEAKAGLKEIADFFREKLALDQAK